MNLQYSRLKKEMIRPFNQSILELVLWILEKNVTPLSYDVSFFRHLAVLMCNIPAPFEGVQLKYLLITEHLVSSSVNSKNAFVIAICQLIWWGV